ncbi:TlpA disulfide reductase family protein [uncultured Ferrovibrio sp.]|jgi:thiol-disulfide isomerase/thioredoxin|uniref:TlpA family protein disulfide reductase n=1 Tax=uncultured Ferrovibrio sp. TaxID=1576913 RepID=UPI00261D5125|nr:TlpA disulfide reductase family protein [uncultured Ferrovibrio sp.]
MMRFLKGVALICLSLAAAAWDAGAAGLPLEGEMRKLSVSAERKPVAAAEFRDEKDAPVTLEAFRGKIVLLNLWATWCVPCREEMPALDRLQAQRGGADFQVVAVAQDRGGRAKVEKFLTEIGATTLTPYLDPTMKSGRTWGAAGLPATILIDRQGREVARLYGAAEWDQADALKLIDALIAEK